MRKRPMRRSSFERAGTLQGLSSLFLGAILCVLWTANAVAQQHAERKQRLAPDYLSGEEAQAAGLYRKALPTVVIIATTRQVLTEEGLEQRSGIGSGVLISPECHVLTAAHVVEGADGILVKTHDGELRPAELLFSESAADIALLKFQTPAPELSHATLGDSDALAVGQLAYAIGSPYGLENSLSVGHISAFREFNRLYDGTIRAEFIQTDAAINSGNSGGPIFNSRGEVIGIASRILTVSGGFQGLGFVVAINTAKQLMTLEDRPWIGIEGIFLGRKQLGSLLNLDLDGGLLILRVTKGSPADRAGLRGGSIPARVLGQDIPLGGDLLLEFGTQETCHSECLVHAHRRISGMDRIPVKFLRDGKITETIIDVSATRRNFLKDEREDTHSPHP